MIYLIAALVVSALVLGNVPRLPWIDGAEGGPVGILRGFSHGMVGFSYLCTWLLVAGGVYQLILGILYYDMDTTEQTRFTFTLESGGTARLMWISGGLTLAFGILYGIYIFGHDAFAMSGGISSSIASLIAAWLYWLAFPLYEQVGLDRAEL